MATSRLSSSRKTATASKKTTHRRRNFDPAVVRDIAFEAHLFCSNPTCCRFTSYSTTSGRARSIAEAAHINAASPGGPRVSTSLRDEDVRSAANGIWLCKICHDRIDADPSAFPEAILFDWKRRHAAFVKQLVGKDFDIALFDLFARTRNTAECIAFLAFIENRRVFFEALTAEVPWQVADSLLEVRARIVEARSHLLPTEPAVASLGEMRTAIHRFLSANPTLHSLRCDGNDPVFVKFERELRQLRTDLLPHVLAIAVSVNHTLNPEILAEASRILPPAEHGTVAIRWADVQR